MSDPKENVEQQQNNPLSRKLDKILKTRLENDRDLLEAIKSLSGFFTENNLRNRRNLRSDIECRTLSLNEEFLFSLSKVKYQIDSVYNDVKAMHDCCRDMTGRLKVAKSQTRDLISQTTRLQNESAKVNMKHQVAAAFLEKFQLKSNEVKILRGSRDGHLHSEFFTVLNKVKRIHSDCKILLRSNQQTAGLEIMEAMALIQETAYEHLFRWIQSEFRLLSNDQIEITSNYCMAMVSLQDRQGVFQFALDEYGTARRSVIVRCFIEALTRGSSSTRRPIELNSHDALRYVGDILAWIHECCATEKEYLRCLLKDCEKLDLSNIMSHISQGLSRPLKVRLEQVLLADRKPIILYKLTNLLQFYCDTLKTNNLSSESGLLITLNEMLNLNLQMFYNSLNAITSKFLNNVDLPAIDLSVAPTVSRTLQLVDEIFLSNDSSLISIELRKMDFIKIGRSVIEPLIKMCSLSASNLNCKIDMAVYMLNNLHIVQSTLSVYEFTGELIEMLQASMDAHIDTLINEEAVYVLTKTDLAEFYNSIELLNKNDEINIDLDRMKKSMMKFDSFLASADSLMLQQCRLLISVKLKDIVKMRAMKLIIRAYSSIYNIFKQKYSDDINAIAPRRPDQVEQLLS